MSSRNAATGATIATLARSADVASVAVVAPLREDAGNSAAVSWRRYDPRWFALNAALLVGCAQTPLPPAAEGPPVQDLSVEVADVTFSVAGAWVEDDGDGHGVDAKASVAGPPPLTITGQRSSWRLKDGVVVFEGEVTAVRGDVTLYADRLEVRYEGARVEEAAATGAVRVVKGEREARGERATLTTADGRVVLEGSPTLSEGPNRMSGERIVLFLDDERLECERCRLEVDGDAVSGAGARGTPAPGGPR